MLKLSDFDYDLPKELIAQHPLKERQDARLLVVRRKEGVIEDSVFKRFTGYLGKDDALVLNDTRVLPARVMGKRKTGGKVEFLLLRRKTGLTFESLIRPARIKLGEKITCNGGKVCAAVTGKNEVTFQADSAEQVYAHGCIPLPPYIKRQPDETDRIYYQTVYARQDGSVAAPTAGLHFTDGLLEEIAGLGARIVYVTLHIGYATFKPVKSEDITRHRMEPEQFFIPPQVPEAIRETRSRQGRVIAVGTTSLRALESYSTGMKEGRTDLFIYPGYEFKAADCLLTNFHLPRTTLFMLVCALGGTDLMRKAYRHAVEAKYRFYSYGDAMLIL
jgi:S-adenosylmethionine:tRNA ribosyltransferase-isomerase